MPSQGKVYLVGAGPGDPGLITLRGVECLRRADVILYDYLANERLLEHAPAAAERICVGKHGRSRLWPQSEINEQLVHLAREDKQVVRLKGGDPIVFARATEELEALVQAGVAFEIVPGITAALAAGSYAGIPITHRDHASAIALVTGQEHTDKDDLSLDYPALAAFPGTLVFYMGVTTAPAWTRKLIEAGKPAATPVAIIRRCSWPDQTRITCKLGEVAERLTAGEKVRPPAIIVVGEVASLGERFSWFDRRPLFGRRIMVTRPREQAGKLTAILEELGAEVLAQPAIEISPPASWTGVDEALSRLREFDWVVFSSSNGVRYLLARMLSSGRDMRALAAVQLAAIGPGTAEELAAYHLRADLQPSEFRAESLAAELRPRAAGRRFLLVRASRGREVLAEELVRAGASVTQVIAYQSTDVTTPAPDVAQALAEGGIDWVTVTSSAIASSLVNLFGEHLRQTRLASISPITSATLRRAGYEPTAEATEYTMAGVADAILKHSSLAISSD